MRQNSHLSLNLAGFKATLSPPKKQYKSKLIADLMNSDSSDDEEYNPTNDYDYNEYLKDYQQQQKKSVQLDRQSIHKFNNPSTQKISHLGSRQNKENQSRQFIKYHCYKLNGDKLIEHSDQENTLNIEQASMIPIKNEQEQYSSLYGQQKHDVPLFNDKKQLRQRSTNQAHFSNNHQTNKQAYRSKVSFSTKGSDMQLQLVIQQKQKQINNHKKQINLLKQQIKMKDMFYEELKEKQGQSSIKIKNYEQKISQFNQQIKRLNNKVYALENSVKEKRELIQKKEKINKSDSNTIYDQIAVYIQKIVEQSKNKLMQHKMSPLVQSIIEQFMTQLLNINRIAVSRSKSRVVLFDSTPNKENKSNLSNNCNYSNVKSSSILTKTPQRQKNQRQNRIQKSQQLRDLQKSLQKLRDMERVSTPYKSQINKYSGVVKYNTSINNNNSQINKNDSGNPYSTTNAMISGQYDSLDRSSIMFLDRSANRSISKRKKIFDRAQKNNN